MVREFVIIKAETTGACQQVPAGLVLGVKAEMSLGGGVPEPHVASRCVQSAQAGLRSSVWDTALASLSLVLFFMNSSPITTAWEGRHTRYADVLVHEQALG